MRKFLFCVALALLVVAAFGSVIDREEDDDESPTRERRQAGGKKPPQKKKVVTCQSMSFSALSKCCKTPAGKFFQDKALSACSPNGKSNNPSLNAWAREFKLNMVYNTKAKNAVEIGKESNKKLVEAATCGLECAYKGEGLLNEDGTVKVDAAKEFIVKAVPESWKATMALIIDNCKDYAQNMTAQKITKAGGSAECSLHPITFHQCVRRKAPENCPQEADGSGGMKDLPTCKSQISAIKKCNPNGGILTTAAPAADAPAATAAPAAAAPLY